MQQLKKFDGKMLKSTTKEGLDIEDENERKKLEELKAEFEPLPIAPRRPSFYASTRQSQTMRKLASKSTLIA